MAFIRNGFIIKVFVGAYALLRPKRNQFLVTESIKMHYSRFFGDIRHPIIRPIANLMLCQVLIRRLQAKNCDLTPPGLSIRIFQNKIFSAAPRHPLTRPMAGLMSCQVLISRSESGNCDLTPPTFWEKRYRKNVFPAAPTPLDPSFKKDYNIQSKS